MQAHGRLEQEPWTYDAETLELYRGYGAPARAPVPYVRSAAARPQDEPGVPIIRPLPLVDPGDDRGWTISDSFGYGPSLWVAPVLEQAAERRRAYLPRGRWRDFWTGAAVEGGRDVVVPAPLNRIPVWVREGSIVVTHPAESVAHGLGEDGVATRPLEATLWGQPLCGRAKVRLADGTEIGWRDGTWSIGRPPGAPEREIRLLRAA